VAAIGGSRHWHGVDRGDIVQEIIEIVGKMSSGHPLGTQGSLG